MLMGDITSFEVLKSNGDYLAIRNDSTKMGNDDILYQFNMFETGADFGKRVGKVYTKLWEIVTKDYVNNKFYQNLVVKQFDSKITSTQNPGEVDRIHINIEQQEGYRQVCITRGWITNPKLMVYNLFESGGGADITFANISNTVNTGGNVYIQVLFQKI